MPLTFHYSYFSTHTDINPEVQRRTNNSLQAQVNKTQETETCWEGTFTPTHSAVELHLAFDDMLFPVLFHLIQLRRIWVLLSQLNSPVVETTDGDVRISWNQDPEEAQLGRGHGEKSRGHEGAWICTEGHVQGRGRLLLRHSVVSASLQSHGL